MNKLLALSLVVLVLVSSTAAIDSGKIYIIEHRGSGGSFDQGNYTINDETSCSDVNCTTLDRRFYIS